MTSNVEFLYLVSSNASVEYILDILETLAIPFGSVQHFRYQLRWLDDDIKANLPERRLKKANKLKDIKVVTCYLYQQKKAKKWEWIAINPIRIGTLVNAYKTGTNEEDIAHFYFQVENYIKYGDVNFSEMINEISNSKWEKKYSFLGRPFGNQYIANKNESRSAFHKICECLDQEHFKSPEQKNKKYYPLFCYLEGLSKKEEIISPKYDSSSYKSYYDLNEGAIYNFEFMTYTPRKQKIPNATIKISSDSKFFTTPSQYKLEITSRYNAESTPLISTILEKDIWSIISFETKINNPIDNLLPLNLRINFPIKIKRRIFFRVVDALSDLGFGVGTGSLAFKAALQTWTWWYWPTLIGYAIWAISKVLIKLWKG